MRRGAATYHQHQQPILLADLENIDTPVPRDSNSDFAFDILSEHLAYALSCTVTSVKIATA
jgi:hypothetical protein